MGLVDPGRLRWRDLEPLEPRTLLSAGLWSALAYSDEFAALAQQPWPTVAMATQEADSTPDIPALDLVELFELPSSSWASIDHIALTSDGAIIIAGQATVPGGFTGGEFGQVINPPSNTWEAFVARFSSDGSTGEWITFASGTIRSFSVDASDTIWLQTTTSVWLSQHFVSRLNGNGVEQWREPLYNETTFANGSVAYGVYAVSETFHFMDAGGGYAAGSVFEREDSDDIWGTSRMAVVHVTPGGNLVEATRFDYRGQDAPALRAVEVIGADTILSVRDVYNPDIGFAGDYDRFDVVVYNASGWAVQGPFTGRMRDITQDPHGNLIVVGDIVNANGVGEKAFVSKLSSSGNLIWHTVLDGSYLDSARTVTSDPYGNILVGGFSSSYNWPFINAFDDATPFGGFSYVAAMDPEGQVLWNTGVGRKDGIKPGEPWESGLTADGDYRLAWGWTTHDYGAATSTIGVARIHVLDGPEPPRATLAYPAPDTFVPTQQLNESQYVEVTFDLTDVSTIDGDELLLEGAGVGTVSVVGVEQVNDTTFRYLLEGLFDLGPVAVNFLENTFTSTQGVPATSGGGGTFWSMPALDPLQVLPAEDWVYDEASGTFKSVGVTTFGAKPGTGEAFVPVLAVDGTVEVGTTHLTASGLVVSLTGGFADGMPLFAGEFDIPIGQTATSLLLDQTQADLGGLAIASLDVNTFSKMAIVVPPGGSAADARIELQAALTMPEELGGVKVSLADPHRIVLSPAGVNITGGSISFPKVEFNLLYLLPVKASGMMIEYIAATNPPAPAPPTPELLRLRGKLELPDVWNLTADFSKDAASGQDNYIEIAVGDPIPVINVVGTMSLEKLVLVPGLWEIDEAKLTLDTARHLVQGDATITVPPGIEIIGGLGFLDGSLNYVRFGLEGFNSPIGATGAFLQKIAGDVTNIAPAATDPVQFGGDLGLTAGPKVYADLPDWAGGSLEGALVELDLRGAIDVKHLTGEGKLKMVGGVLTGTGKSELNWDKGFLSSLVSIEALAKALKATAKLKADSDMNLTMSGKGTLTIPEQIPIWGKTEIGSANMLVHFTNDGNYANDLIAAWGETTISAFNGSMKIVAGLRVNFDGSWQLLGARRLTQLPSPAAASLGLSNLAASMSVTSNPNAVLVEPGAGWLMMHAGWELDTDSAALVVTSPDGTHHDEAAIAAHPDMEIVEALSGGTSRAVLIREPQPGLWSLQVNAAQPLGLTTYEAFEQAPGSSVDIESSSYHPTTRTVTIDYRSTTTSPAVVHLYYDDDAEGEDGLLIASDLLPDAGPVMWDVGDLPDGEYFVYAVIVDESGIPMTAYSEQAVVVTSAPTTIPVTLGNGAAKSVTYTDADGTTATVQLKGGLGTLHFTGDIDDIEDTKKGIIVTGTNVAVSQVVIEDASSASLTVKLKDGDGRVTWGGLTADGSVKSIKARNVDIAGDVAIAGLLGGADLGHLLGPGTFTTGGSAADKGGKIIVQQIEEFSFNTSAPIGSFTAATWLDRDGEPDELRAASLGKVAIADSMEADIVATDSTAKSAIKQLAVGGWLDGSTIDAAGNVDKVTLGGMRHSQLRMGLNAGITSLPTTAGAFVNQSATLKSLTITGAVQANGSSFIESLVAGWNMGNIKLGVVATNADETDSLGLAARTIKAVDYTADGTRTAMKKLAGPADDLVSGDFVLRLV